MTSKRMHTRFRAVEARGAACQVALPYIMAHQIWMLNPTGLPCLLTLEV